VIGFLKIICLDRKRGHGVSSTCFDCTFCQLQIRKGATLIQTIIAALIHGLNEHSDNQELYTACLADIEAIQEATDLQLHLKTPPAYNPITVYVFCSLFN
jgi:hypothetical protein